MRDDFELSSPFGVSSRLSRNRPTHVALLEGFEGLGQVWMHGCRCCEHCTIEEANMENKVRLVAWLAFSEVMSIGYEYCLIDHDTTPGGRKLQGVNTDFK